MSQFMPDRGTIAPVVALLIVLFAHEGNTATTKRRTGQDILIHSSQLAVPAWVKWIGWSKSGDRLAWRTGKAGTGNNVGAPVWLGHLDFQGTLVKRRFLAHEPGRRLKKATVRRRSRATSRPAGPLDVVMRTPRGEFFAVALRPDMQRLAILRRQGQDYQPVVQMAVAGHSKRVLAWGYPSPNGRWLAVAIHVGRARAQRAMLIIVPLSHSKPNTTQSKVGKRPLR
ncbi:MAG: hypothetical protein CMH53_03015 [Myxococcales bacterium]|nr:hypothetical protein [Myxococcales bacterium]